MKTPSIGDAIKYRETDGDGKVVSTLYVNPKRVVSTTTESSGGGTVLLLRDGSVLRVPSFKWPNPLPYDSEVDYLYNTGGRYINTGFVPTQNTRWEMRAAFLTNNAKMGTDPTTSRFRWIGTNTSIGFDISSGSGSGSFSTTSADYHDFVVDFTTGKAYVDNASKNVAWGSHTQTLKMFLFASNTGSGVDSRATRLYWCKIYDNGVLVRDFIPVRFTNEQGQSEGCMYDRLGVGGMDPDGTLRDDGIYRNLGAGAFVVGPDKP